MFFCVFITTIIIKQTILYKGMCMKNKLIFVFYAAMIAPSITTTQSLIPPINDSNRITKVVEKPAVDKICKNVSYATKTNRRGVNFTPAYDNQDRVFVGSLAGRVGFGVFDGHGDCGAEIAAYVQELLLNKIMSYRSIAKGAIHACSWMQEELKNKMPAKAHSSGTTAIMGVLYGSTMTIINIGDSRAVKISADKSTVQALSIDHKPQEPTEKTRVLAAGGVVYGKYVYTHSGYGLAITRSLGDLAAHDRNVLTHEPSIEVYSAVAGDTVIFASDGFWDVISNEDTRKLIIAYAAQSEEEQEKQTLAEYLAQKAFDCGSRDDITVLVVQI